MANEKKSVGENLRDTVTGALTDAVMRRVYDYALGVAKDALDGTYENLGDEDFYVETPDGMHIGYYNAYLNGVMLPLSDDLFILTVDDCLDVSSNCEEIVDVLRESHALMSPSDLARRFVDSIGDDDWKAYAALARHEDTIFSILCDIIDNSDEYDAIGKLHIEFRPAENRGSIAHAVGLGSRMEQIESEIMQALEEGCDPGAYQMPVMFLNSMFFWYANVKEDGQVDALSFYKSREQLQKNFEGKLKTAPLMLGTHADAEDSLLPYWNGDIQMNTGMSGNM